MSDETKKEIKFIGCENEWRETPEILKKCRDAGHKKEMKALNSRGTYNRYTCYECGFCFTVDSSD